MKLPGRDADSSCIEYLDENDIQAYRYNFPPGFL